MSRSYPPPPTKFGPASIQARTSDAKSPRAVLPPPPARFGATTVQRRNLPHAIQLAPRSAVSPPNRSFSFIDRRSVPGSLAPPVYRPVLPARVPPRQRGAMPNVVNGVPASIVTPDSSLQVRSELNQRRSVRNPTLNLPQPANPPQGLSVQKCSGQIPNPQGHGIAGVGKACCGGCVQHRNSTPSVSGPRGSRCQSQIPGRVTTKTGQFQGNWSASVMQPSLVKRLQGQEIGKPLSAKDRRAILSALRGTCYFGSNDCNLVEGGFSQDFTFFGDCCRSGGQSWMSPAGVCRRCDDV